MIARAIPFVFNARDSLVLVFTDQRVRFVKHGAAVKVADVIYSVVTPYLEADLARLGYVQSGNVVTLVHPSYPVQELTRTADDDWAIAEATFGAAILSPDAFTGFTAGADMDTDLTGWVYTVTSVGADGEESIIDPDLTAADFAHDHKVLTLKWNPVDDAQSYRIYRRPPMLSADDVGGYGLIGVSATALFTDYGRDPDFAQQPPIERVVFDSENNYPSAVGYWQQRRVFANTNTDPDRVWASQTGRPNNFNISVPIKDDDAVDFRLVSDTVDEIRHILTQAQLTILTEGGEWAILGDSNGVLTPVVINPRKVSSHGVGVVRPAPASGGLLFPQALGSTLLQLAESAVARDLTLFSTHLFDGHQIVDMAWQQETPHVVWLVRDDGVLLGLTYIPDQDVIAWHRHDFLDGTAESVCVVPEPVGTRIEHVAYVVVLRGVVRSLERVASPFSGAINEEAWLLDGAVEYDGRGTSTAADTVAGLGHLEGRDVAVYAWGKTTEAESVSESDDIGYVVANPLRDDLDVLTVSGGAIVLPDSYLRILVGLPYISDLETLDVDNPDGPTMKTQKTNIGRVGAQIIESRNLWAGGALPNDDTPVEDMQPLALSTDSDFDDLVTDFVQINTKGEWQTNGRVALRSIDPTPFTVLSIVPQGFFPDPRQG